MVDVEALVTRCRAGDELAWEALVRTFQARVYGLALHYLRNAEEARDTAQDVFVQLYRRLDRYTGGSFEAWLMQVARNRCIDRLRRIKARPLASDTPLDEGPPIPDDAPGPEESWLTDSRRRLVYRALGRLSDINREMIVLKEIEGLELNEIARMIGVPLGTAKSRSNRARLELAREIVKLDPSYGAPK